MYEQLRVDISSIQCANPDAEGERALELNPSLLNGDPDFFGHVHRSWNIRFWQDERKLFATNTRDHIGGTAFLLKATCDELQGLVTDLMTKRIVVLFEVINIQDHDAQRAPESPAAIHLIIKK